MSKALILIAVILLLELLSDVAVVLWMGGWSLLVLPFMIFIQVVFDLVLFVMVGIAAYSGRTRVID